MKALLISCGHGLTAEGEIDNGAIGSSTTEREHVVAIGRLLVDACHSLPLEVIPIGIDERLSVAQKTKKINAICKNKGYGQTDAAMIELHMNSGPSAAHGVEAWYSDGKPDAKGFAGTLVTDLANGSGLFLRPNPVNKSSQNRLGRLGILDDTIPLSALLEVGFVTNQQDVTIVEAYRSSIVNGILKGLRDFLHIPVNSTIPADISPNDWFYDDVIFLLGEKIFDRNSTFRPGDTITRGEMAVVIARVLHALGK